jgi:hypothetical protein
MADAAVLGPGKTWRLHVRTDGAVPGPGYMETPFDHGTNTEVFLTFPSTNLSSMPETNSPVPEPVAWWKADFQPQPGDRYDDFEHRGWYWARFIPAAIDDHVMIQIAQVGYPTTGAGPNTIRLLSGRLQTRLPLMFFGHGAGNDNLQLVSFTFTLFNGAIPPPNFL